MKQIETTKTQDSPKQKTKVAQFEGLNNLNTSKMILPIDIKQKIESKYPDIGNRVVYPRERRAAAEFGYFLSQEEIKQLKEEIERLNRLNETYFTIINTIKDRNY